MIGHRIKEERERLGLTQPEFAQIAGAAKRTVIDWQNGTSSPTAAQLAALAASGVDVLYVVTGLRAAVHRRLGAIKQASEFLQAANVPVDIGRGLLPAIVELLSARTIDPDEVELLNRYRECRSADQAVIQQMTRRFAENVLPERPTVARKKRGPDKEEK